MTQPLGDFKTSLNLLNLYCYCRLFLHFIDTRSLIMSGMYTSANFSMWVMQIDHFLHIKMSKKGPIL